jgi:hypothetical protein
MFEVIEVVENLSTQPLEVWFEPWGMPHDLPPGETFRVIATAEEPGELEITYEDHRATVYGWAGCTMRVYCGDDLVDDFNIKFPPLPNKGISTKTLIHALFGGPGFPRK